MVEKRGGRMILASIKPYYYYLIAEGIKKIEVRKSALKNLPQDIAFYMSKDERSFAKIPKEFQEKYRKHFGKVGMRVVCDKIDSLQKRGIDNNFDYCYLSLNEWGNDDIAVEITDIKKSCISKADLNKYGANVQWLYAWHISDLKIYGKPKELSEFRKSGFMTEEEWLFNLYPNTHCHYEAWAKKFEITRPPQSYMFVEEV